MTHEPLPGDYDASDGIGDGGIEQCPHCGTSYDLGNHTGPVYDSSGRKYGNLLDTDPGNGPFFCPECWPELEANRKATKHRQLHDYE